MSDPITFKLLTFYAGDYSIDSDSDSAGDTEYVVKLFGLTQTGQSVSVNVMGYTPHMYVRPPWAFEQCKIKLLERFLSARYGQSFVGIKSFNKKEYWGFQDGTTHQFLQLLFKNHASMKKAAWMFQKPLVVPDIWARSMKFGVYESNIDPLIRFIHRKDIDPCGWVTISAGMYKENKSLLRTTSTHDIQTKWQNVNPMCDNDNIAPYKIAAFDIECVSYDGEFPVAKRDMTKVALGFIDSGLTAAEYFPGMFASGKMVAKDPQKLDTQKLVAALKNAQEDFALIISGKLGYEGNALRPIPPDSPQPDIPVNVGKKLSRITSFPELVGDPIIQIGTTVHLYGQHSVQDKYIFTVGSCDPIDNALVFPYETEAEMLMGWAAFVRQQDFDVLLGFNSFGFDLPYLYERAEELGIVADFSRLGRIRERSCPLKIKMLSSSALGDNLLRYIDIDGRLNIDVMKVVQRDHKLDSYGLNSVAMTFVGEKKNDVSPKEIFKLQSGTAADRKRIAEYCIQDCVLLNKLCIKLEIMANNMGMASVCTVPLDYIFLRGQGVKLFSLVAKVCKQEDYIVPLIKFGGDNDGESTGYEGAIVLDPIVGIFQDNPIVVLDYGSLYPSSMISENISHDTIVLDPKYDNLPGQTYVDVAYTEDGATKTCRYAQSNKGVLPKILEQLLTQRKATRKKMLWQTLDLKNGEQVTGLVAKDNGMCFKMSDGRIIDKTSVSSVHDTFDEFKKGVFDGLQNAYKVTANSLYGQTGARTSPMYMKELAASTTATGRNMIMMAKSFVEQEFKARVIYGDTDSIFIEYVPPPGSACDADVVRSAMQFGVEISEAFKPKLKKPHDLEFDKVMFPFIILSKKRYVGNLYEDLDDPSKFKMKSMGLVLKRRDNANIVKIVYKGIIDMLLNRMGVDNAVNFLNERIDDLIAGRVQIEDLTITKSLSANYKQPDRIAHKVLANRIGLRDPGNKPQSSDRIPYVFVDIGADPKVKTLQGDRIETPTFIREHDLKVDVQHYITNQIMEPVKQLFSIVVEQLPGYVKPGDHWERVREALVVKGMKGEKLDDKMDTLKEDEVQRLLFEPVLESIGKKAKRFIDPLKVPKVVKKRAPIV